MEQEKVDALKAQHGEIFLVDLGDNGEMVLRRPSRLEFRAYKANRQDDAKKIVADEILAKACIVHPDAAAVEALFDKLPALATVLHSEILEIAGGVEVKAKKL